MFHENDENEAEPAGYHYEIIRNAIPEIRVESTKLLQGPESYLVASHYFGFPASACEIRANATLTHSGSVNVPARTWVMLTPEEFATVDFPESPGQDRIDVNLRAQTDDGRWSAWRHISAFALTVPDSYEGGFGTIRYDGLANVDSLADDFTFTRLGDDLLIRLNWDDTWRANRDGDAILLKDFATESHRLEKVHFAPACRPGPASRRLPSPQLCRGCGLPYDYGGRCAASETRGRS